MGEAMDVQKISDSALNPQGSAGDARTLRRGGGGDSLPPAETQLLPEDSVHLTEAVEAEAGEAFSAESLLNELQTLLQALSSGPLAEAQRAYEVLTTALEPLLADSPFWSSQIFQQQIADGLQKLAKAIDAQSVPAAREAYAALTQALQRALQGGAQYLPESDVSHLPLVLQALRQVQAGGPGTVPQPSSGEPAPAATATPSPFFVNQAAQEYSVYGLALTPSSPPPVIEAEPWPGATPAGRARQPRVWLWLLVLDVVALVFCAVMGIVPPTVWSLGTLFMALVASNGLILLLTILFAREP